LSADESWVVVASLSTSCSIAEEASASPPLPPLDEEYLEESLDPPSPPSASDASALPIASLSPIWVVVAVLSPVAIALA